MGISVRTGVVNQPGIYSLWTLQISMDDLVAVEVLHAQGDLLRPGHDGLRGDRAGDFKYILQRAIRAVLHNDAENRRLGTNPPKTMTTIKCLVVKFGAVIASPSYLNLIMFSWSRFLRFLMSVSMTCRTFFTATVSLRSLPL